MVDFLLVLIELLLGVTAERYEQKYHRFKMDVLHGSGGSVSAKFSRERDVPTDHFCTERFNECLTTS